MIKQPIRMLDDPSEPECVRELLRAGANDVVTDYNFEKGLALHLGHIAAGTPPPPWAQSLAHGAKVGAGISAKMAAIWVGLPLASAGVVAAVLLTGNQTPHVTSAKPHPTAIQVSRPRTIDEPRPMVAAVNPEPTKPAEPAAIARPQEPRSYYFVPRRARRPAESYFARHGRNFGTTTAKFEAPARAETPSTADTGFETAIPTRETKPGASAAETAPSPSAREEQPPPAEVAENKPEEKAKIAFTPEPLVQEQKPAEPKLTPLEKEMRMLAAANRYLHSDPERTLALTQSSEREFVNGMFAEERRELIVLSLVKLGRMEEARRLGLNYLHRYPNGPFSDRVRRALATGQVPEE